MNIGIIGAGIAGMSAAYDLARTGHRVTIYERAEQVGGLASGFRDPRWEWPLERFYHHVFEGDTAIRTLTHEIGYGEKLFFRKGVTAHFWNGTFSPIDGPVAVLRFPGVSFLDRVRFGAACFYLKYVTKNWHRLETTTATAWSERWMGKPAYQTIMAPLLKNKFGPYADEVNMAWLWARLRARSFKLGYYAGGFQGFAEALLAAIQQLGVAVHLATPVHRLSPPDEGEAAPDGRREGWTVLTEHGAHHADRVIVTGSPGLLARLAPHLPPDYLGNLAALKSLGAIALTIALKHRLTEGFYWMQGMRREEFPFLALVEHTNFIEPEHYGGDHLVYCGDYLPPDHEYFRLSQEALLERFVPSLARVNPNFRPDWIRDAWLHREPYAQPIVGLNHSQSIPSLVTPLPHLYFASMSQVYPWDRGTNYAVELGQRVAAAVFPEHLTSSPKGGILSL
ncbi:MAG: NAD(P)/FAD-dependent oxidoreductase [Chloroflexaceae bacterium]|nr:NAD(P)/FAD-dependent oxidoreductase [Chloroflexaceae bacterium]